MDLIFKMLEVEPITNPSFTFNGNVVAINGNLPALRAHKRFIKWDLNRIWDDLILKELSNKKRDFLIAEEKELIILKRTIDHYIAKYRSEKVVILDLHTTTADGGIFTLPTSDEESMRIARAIHAPVITGLIDQLFGTCIQYYMGYYTHTRVIGVVFEGGQHDDPLSVNRSIAAVINCMRTIGCVQQDHIENRHDELLVEYSSGLPKIARLSYWHKIEEEDGFQMEPNFLNFQQVERGMLLAYDRNGPIYAPEDGLIIMPLYQKQGNDGYFIVEVLDKYKNG